MAFDGRVRDFDENRISASADDQELSELRVALNGRANVIRVDEGCLLVGLREEHCAVARELENLSRQVLQDGSEADDGRRMDWQTRRSRAIPEDLRHFSSREGQTIACTTRELGVGIEFDDNVSVVLTNSDGLAARHATE